jgi:hypothetical protein
MKPPRSFGAQPHVRYRPRLVVACGVGRLIYSHSVWAVDPVAGSH